MIAARSSPRRHEPHIVIKPSHRVADIANQARANGIAIGPQTISDVDKAFQILARAGIIDKDIQFMITPNGHAVLFDFGTDLYRSEDPFEILLNHNPQRVAVIVLLEDAIRILAQKSDWR